MRHMEANDLLDRLAKKGRSADEADFGLGLANGRYHMIIPRSGCNHTTA